MSNNSVLVSQLAPGDAVILEGERCIVRTPPLRLKRYSQIGIDVERASGAWASVAFDSDIERVEVAR